MPAGKEGGGGKEAAAERRASNADRRGSNTVKRETFRPPWVKEGPDGVRPKPSDLWSKTRQGSKDGGGPETAPAPKKSGTEKVSEAQPQENGTGDKPAKEHTFVKPQLKPVPPKDPAKLQSREVKIPIKLNSVKDLPPEAKKPPLSKTNSMHHEDKNNIDKAIPTERNAIIRQESLKKISQNPRPPPPPPPPTIPRPPDFKVPSIKQIAQIEQLKARPKVRPDWTHLLKDIEGGKKLKHVQCNDRSKPLLPKVKVKDKDTEQFLYESEKSEKETSHNQLLKEIQQGVFLKRVKTNDRSRPVLEGLRKFRRQMTIEEQLIKSQSMASIAPEEVATEEVDELDDIDKVRDDLQSTKQMLALELRNKEALGRDNKRLQTRITQLESELEKEKTNKKAAAVVNVEADEKLLTSLKSEAADAKKLAKDLENKFHEAANQLDNTKSELEEIRKQKQALEKKLTETLSGGKRPSLTGRQDSIRESESEEEAAESDSGGSDNEEKREKRAQRDLKLQKSKLRSYKNKEDNAKKERMALKNQIKRLQQAMKEEKKKYKTLQKEVKKMDAMLKEVGGDSDDEDEEEKEKKEEEEETETESETESESESSETDSESEKSMSEPEDAPIEKKKDNLTKRSNKHEGRLTALKKGNYLLKTNVERLQDDLNKQKEESVQLQHELDSVLSELG